MFNSNETQERKLQPGNPKTWPRCSCRAKGVYLVRVDNPDARRMGDYGCASEMYFTLCGSCKTVAEVCDHIAQELPHDRDRNS